MCPRGDLNPETGEIFPDREIHAIRITTAWAGGPRYLDVRSLFSLLPGWNGLLSAVLALTGCATGAYEPEPA
jgi:hypothetical protein